MGFFSKQQPPSNPEPLGSQATDIYGRGQTSPETPGSRRLRMLGACRQAVDQLDFSNQFDEMLTEPQMSAASEVLSSVFVREPSLIESVATRGAFGYLQANRESLRLLALANGWELEDSGTVPEWRVASGLHQGSTTHFTSEGSFAAQICSVASESRQISGLTMEELRSIPFVAGMSNDDMLKLIAWVVIGASRAEGIGQIRPVWVNIAAPSNLPSPAWYPDPIYESGYRFYDGTDWRTECWLLDGTQAVEMHRPLSMHSGISGF